MTEELKLVVEKEIAKLPKEGRDAIASVDWENISQVIGNKYLINEDEIAEMQLQIFLVLIGIKDPELYANSLENEIGISRKEAEDIYEEVLRKIFIPTSDRIMENIKNSGRIKIADFYQNMDFILSGGDYLSFMEPGAPETGPGISDKTLRDNLGQTLGLQDKFVI